MDNFLGEIRMFAGNFAPAGWALCNGQLFSISQNTALFSLLGTTYGGNGQTTFALPNLQGRYPMHWGTGTGLSPRTLGELSGSENVTLIANQMPAHNHLLSASSNTGTVSTPTQNLTAAYIDPVSGDPLNLFGTAANTTMSPTAVGVAGGSQPHYNMPPYLCVTFIIALQGIFPSHG